MPHRTRQDEGIDWEAMFQTFRHAPWWAGPLSAGGVLVLFCLVLPLLISAIGTTSEMAGPMAEVVRSIVPIFGACFAVGILIIWGMAMAVKPFDRKRLDTQRGPETVDTLTRQQFELLPACPRCGAAMERRIAKRGPNTGKPFFGCSRYPQCKSTLAVASSS